MGAAKEDTHKPLFQDCASSSTSLYILAVAPSVIPPLLSSPLLSSPVQLLWPVFTLLERERERERGPREGTMPSFRETVDPMVEQGSLHGGRPTPLPQTSQPSATELYAHIRISGRHAHPNDTTLLPSSASLSHVSHKPPSRQPWPFGGCSRDPVAPVQDPHTVSHFPVSTVSPPRNDHEGGLR